MKKAPIAVALVLVFGLFASAFSLTPAIAQNTTTTSTGNTTGTTNTTSTNTTTSSTNATGETFSASGAIAALIFDLGETTTSSESSSDTTTASNDTSMTGNMTTSSNATLSTGNDTTVMMPQVMIGDNSTGSSNMTSMESNMTSTDNMTSTSNETSTSAEIDPPYVLAGDWNLEVQDGNVTDFAANFTMVHIDGTGRHMHELSNFEPSGPSTIDTSGEGSSFLFGTVDVATNGETAWTAADVLIIIEKNNVVSISLATEDTEDHFMGQPIYGIVESMTDAEGNEMISTTATSSETMSNTTQTTEGTSNETGGVFSNLTEGITGGIEDLFNGTG